MWDYSLTHSGYIGILGGAFLGHLIEMKLLKLNISNVSWHKTSPLKVVIRIILTLVTIALSILPYFLFFPDEEEPELLKIWLLKYFFCFFFSAFFIFGFLRLVFYKLRLINESALGKMYQF